MVSTSKLHQINGSVLQIGIKLCRLLKWLETIEVNIDGWLSVLWCIEIYCIWFQRSAQGCKYDLWNCNFNWPTDHLKVNVIGLTKRIALVIEFPQMSSIFLNSFCANRCHHKSYFQPCSSTDMNEYPISMENELNIQYRRMSGYCSGLRKKRVEQKKSLVKKSRLNFANGKSDFLCVLQFDFCHRKVFPFKGKTCSFRSTKFFAIDFDTMNH